MSDGKHDGGPAFPHPAIIAKDGDTTVGAVPGMSLRDWFAGRAMQAMIAARFDYDGAAPHEKSTAESSYNYADAMLAERDRKS